jgi:hypothetical protein
VVRTSSTCSNDESRTSPRSRSQGEWRLDFSADIFGHRASLRLSAAPEASWNERASSAEGSQKQHVV